MLGSSVLVHVVGTHDATDRHSGHFNLFAA